MKPNLLLLSSAACFSLFTGTGLAFAQDPVLEDQLAPPMERVLDSASRAANIELGAAELLQHRAVHLPYSGVDVIFVKVRDNQTGEEQRLVLNQQLELVDYDELMEVENGIRYQIFGNMHPELQRRILAGAEQAPVQVMIKVRAEEEFVDKTAVDRGEMTTEELGQRAGEVREAVEAITRERLNAALVRAGAAPFSTLDADGPFVELTLRADVAMTLAYDEDVVFIGPAGEERIHDASSIPDSLPTTRTNLAHSYSKGSGVKIAVLESGQATTSQNCFPIASRQTSLGSGNSHMTKSLGIISSRYNNGWCFGPWVGYAPEASILMANSSNYQSAYSWAKNLAVDVVTMSWHYISEENSSALHSRDEYFDYWSVRYPYPMVFTSAGNQASGNKFASGKGFNFFGVGNVINDGDGNRCDDVISSSSSFKNPTASGFDREIPEIAAPGSTHTLLGTTFGGTSCATPVSASIATCLIGANTSLRSWPEGVRAILQATANYQDADGADFNRLLDGKDGTGMLDAWYATLAGNTRANNTSSYYRAHDYGYMNKADFGTGYLNESWKVRVGSTNSRVRVALTWNSKTTSTSSVLDADLDLRVYAPNGSLVATSSSWTNNNEFVEFTPSVSGDYLIKVRGYSVPNNFSSYFGVAWTVMYDCL